MSVHVGLFTEWANIELYVEHQEKHTKQIVEVRSQSCRVVPGVHKFSPACEPITPKPGQRGLDKRSSFTFLQLFLKSWRTTQRANKAIPHSHPWPLCQLCLDDYLLLTTRRNKPLTRGGNEPLWTTWISWRVSACKCCQGLSWTHRSLFNHRFSGWM